MTEMDLAKNPKQDFKIFLIKTKCLKQLDTDITLSKKLVTCHSSTPHNI